MGLQYKGLCFCYFCDKIDDFTSLGIVTSEKPYLLELISVLSLMIK